MTVRAILAALVVSHPEAMKSLDDFLSCRASSTVRGSLLARHPPRKRSSIGGLVREVAPIGVVKVDLSTSDEPCEVVVKVNVELLGEVFLDD